VNIVAAILLLEEERSHLLEAAAPSEELVRCAFRNVRNGIVSSCLEVFN
jgi:hypothetical protein